MLSLLSALYMSSAKVNCFSLFMHCVRFALFLARLKVGNNIAAKIAMIAITTNNSIKVNAGLFRGVEPLTANSCRPDPRREDVTFETRNIIVSFNTLIVFPLSVHRESMEHLSSVCRPVDVLARPLSWPCCLDLVKWYSCTRSAIGSSTGFWLH